MLGSPITEPEPGLEEDRRELRVRVPERLVNGLLRLKVLEGVDMSNAVAAALDEYLAQERP